MLLRTMEVSFSHDTHLNSQDYLKAGSDAMANASVQMTEYSKFWPEYLKDHSKSTTRYFHFFGTGVAVFMFIWIAMAGSWFGIWKVLLAAYGPAWISHLLVERNKPCSFKAPFWSAFFLFLTGRLKGELVKANIEDMGSDGLQLINQGYNKANEYKQQYYPGQAPPEDKQC